MKEVWKPYPKSVRYLVSNLGQVMNSKSNRILKPWLAMGYPTVHIGNKKIAVHRIMAFTFLGDPLLGQTEVNHKDGVKSNNILSNLEWVSRSQNIQHSYDNGMSKKRYGHTDSVGSKNSMAKLTEDDVIKIRQIHSTNKYSYSKIGKMYDVNQATICYIVNRKTWKHI